MSQKIPFMLFFSLPFNNKDEMLLSIKMIKPFMQLLKKKKDKLIRKNKSFLKKMGIKWLRNDHLCYKIIIECGEKKCVGAKKRLFRLF